MKLTISKSSTTVFFVSILFCLVLKFIEEYVGIGWDYHPDAVLYINESDFIVDEIIYNNNFFSYLNNGYYFIVSFFNSSIFKLVFLNILLFSVTNVIYYKNVKEIKSKYFYIFFLIVILSPYRAHLAVHVLKDTIIIFLLTSFVFSKTFSSKLLFLLSNLYVRIFSLIYYIYILNKKKINFISYAFVFLVLIFLIYQFPILFDFISERNTIDMGGRSFDQIINFSEFGLFGVLIRALVWPLIFVTGMFLFMSPNLLFIPIFLEILIINIFTNFKFAKSIKFILLLSILAIIVNSFTAYIRYIYPLIILTVIDLKKNE